MIRNIPSAEKKIYLTFDDGPDPEFTETVLEILRRHDVPATFFVIAQKARAYKRIMEQIQAGGHAIGNHSLDHSYGVFFAKREKMLSWIDEAEDVLGGVIGDSAVGFRPPNGICTPHLKSVLRERKTPLILWNVRFYDAVFRWTPAKAVASLEHTKGGDLVLLHDRQRPAHRQDFAAALEAYVTAARRQQFQFARLTKEDCLSWVQADR